MLLVAATRGLELRVVAGEPGMRGGRGVWADWEAINTTSGAGSTFKQPIAKAVGLRRKKDLPITVLDATAGWGKDAWLLAALGCRVLAVERSGLVAALLRDARARAGLRWPEVAERIWVARADSRDLLRLITANAGAKEPGQLPREAHGFSSPDVIYLDPMFAGAAKRKTAEQKSMRVLRRLVGADDDAAELFMWALRAAGKRVVVKQPANGGLDFGVKAVATHRGKAFRFDVYLPGVKKTV